MKKLLLISLVVLLAVSFGIAMFPTQSVAALEKGGLTFHIKAKGEGTYTFGHPQHPTEEGDGDFSINIAGQKGWGYKCNRGYWGWGHPRDTVQGHIKGSFGEHEINITLVNPGGNNLFIYLDSLGRLKNVYFHLKGTYDGNKIETFGNWVRAYYDGNGVLTHISVELGNVPGVHGILFIEMSNASLDLHQNPN